MLADDPSLTVRLVPGRTRSRWCWTAVCVFRSFQSYCGNKTYFPWIITGTEAEPERQAALESLGARVYRLPSGDNGGIELKEVLQRLGEMGINSLMVEGGEPRLLPVFWDFRQWIR